MSETYRPDEKKKSNALPWILGLGALGGGAYYLSENPDLFKKDDETPEEPGTAPMAVEIDNPIALTIDTFQPVLELLGEVTESDSNDIYTFEFTGGSEFKGQANLTFDENNRSLLIKTEDEIETETGTESSKSSITISDKDGDKLLDVTVTDDTGTTLEIIDGILEFDDDGTTISATLETSEDFMEEVSLKDVEVQITRDEESPNTELKPGKNRPSSQPAQEITTIAIDEITVDLGASLSVIITDMESENSTSQMSIGRFSDGVEQDRQIDNFNFTSIDDDAFELSILQLVEDSENLHIEDMDFAYNGSKLIEALSFDVNIEEFQGLFSDEDFELDLLELGKLELTGHDGLELLGFTTFTDGTIDLDGDGVAEFENVNGQINLPKLLLNMSTVSDEIDSIETFSESLDTLPMDLEDAIGE